jgi:hypothetical protein
MISRFKILRRTTFFMMILLIGGCGPKGCTLTSKTIEIRPVFVKTLLAEQYPTAGWDIACPFGAAAYGDPGPDQVMVGWDHMTNEGTFCTKASDHIYQGALWFAVRETIGHKNVTKAILKFNRVEGEFNCLVKLCHSEDTWITNSGRNKVSVADCLTTLQHQGDAYAIDVTSMVRSWALNTQENKGFILVGAKEDFAGFSIKGMPSFDGCIAMFQNFSLVITYWDPNP